MALTCWFQALLALVWVRKREDVVVLAAGFRILQTTAYRYRDEVTIVLAQAAPDLHEALQRVAEQGWSHVVLDGKLFHTDRVAATTISEKGETINSWYSGKHHSPGGHIQAIMRPDGFPAWISDTAPGHRHDMESLTPSGVPAPRGAQHGTIRDHEGSSTWVELTERTSPIEAHARASTVRVVCYAHVTVITSMILLRSPRCAVVHIIDLLASI